MRDQKITCGKHGAQELAIACIHVCKAIDSGEQVGFFWDSRTADPRPDAWCRSCERWNREHPEAGIQEWMKVAEFKFLCVRCWDEAKKVLYGRD
jgi:hypothetical protein